MKNTKTTHNHFLNGIIKENPLLVLVIGLCPVVAVSTSLANSIGMGIATTAVLVCSNVLVALFRKHIPDALRIPMCIIIISTFVSATDYALAAWFPSLHAALGIFIPLIVVNCIILGRAEAFAYHNTVHASFLDGLGMGCGFTLVLGIMGFIRELVGNGTIAGTITLFKNPVLMMILPPGGFIALGIIMAIAQLKKRNFQ